MNQQLKRLALDGCFKGKIAVGTPLVGTVCYHSFSLCNCDSKSAEELLNVVRSYKVNDNRIDMTYIKNSSISVEDKIAMQQLEKLSRRIDNYFETELLWRGPETLPDGSFYMAKRRATILHEKMEKDPNLKSVLQAKITDYVRKGYARKLLPTRCCLRVLIT